MLSGDGNENSQKISVGELAKKQLCTYSTPFFVHFVANVKLPENS